MIYFCVIVIQNQSRDNMLPKQGDKSGSSNDIFVDCMQKGKYANAKAHVGRTEKSTLDKYIEYSRHTYYTPLILAVIKDQAELVRELLKYGANPNKGDRRDQSTPLIYAILNRKTAILEILLESEHTNLEYSDGLGNTPLLRLAQHSNGTSDADMVTMLRALVKGRACLTTQNNYGQTMVSILIQNKKLSVLAELIESPEPIRKRLLHAGLGEYRSTMGDTLLIKFAKGLAGIHPGRLCALLTFFDTQHINHVNTNNETALMWFLSQKKVEHAILVAEKMTKSFEACTQKKTTALMTAVRLGATQLVYLLMEKGADCEAQDCNGNTALMHAIQKGNIELAMCLTEEASSIHIPNSAGEIPLISAIRLSGKNDDEAALVKLLMQKGANFNAQDCNGNTPLLLAIQKGNNELAMSLTEEASSINIPNNAGETPLIAAIKYCYLTGSPKLVYLLMEKGANCKAQDSDGNTPLMHALQKGNTELAMHFVDIGSALHTPNKFGEIPLHYCGAVSPDKLHMLVLEVDC